MCSFPSDVANPLKNMAFNSMLMIFFILLVILLTKIFMIFMISAGDFPISDPFLRMLNTLSGLNFVWIKFRVDLISRMTKFDISRGFNFANARIRHFANDENIIFMTRPH